ncbi:MAG: hypothetical protein QM747_21995 [Nocardioides sp.]
MTTRLTPFTRRAASLTAAGLLTVGALAGCGSSSSPTTTSGGGPSSHLQGQGPGGGFGQDPALMKKITTCLKAAGLSSSLPTGRPSGFPSGGPSAYSSGSPVPRPTQGTGGGVFFGNTKVQAALKACGITLPRPSGAPSGYSSPN